MWCLNRLCVSSKAIQSLKESSLAADNAGLLLASQSRVRSHVCVRCWLRYRILPSPGLTHKVSSAGRWDTLPLQNQLGLTQTLQCIVYFSVANSLLLCPLWPFRHPCSCKHEHPELNCIPHLIPRAALGKEQISIYSALKSHLVILPRWRRSVICSMKHNSILVNIYEGRKKRERQ